MLQLKEEDDVDVHKEMKTRQAHDPDQQVNSWRKEKNEGVFNSFC